MWTGQEVGGLGCVCATSEGYPLRVGGEWGHLDVACLLLKDRTSCHQEAVALSLCVVGVGRGHCFVVVSELPTPHKKGLLFLQVQHPHHQAATSFFITRPPTQLQQRGLRY